MTACSYVKKAIATATLVLLAAVITSCAGAPPIGDVQPVARSGGRGVGSYFAARGRDFLDIFHGTGVGYGYGLDAGVQVTEFAMVGVGASQTRKIRIDRKHRSSEELFAGFGAAPFISDFGAGPDVAPFITYVLREKSSAVCRECNALAVVITDALIGESDRPAVNKFDIEVSATALVPSFAFVFSPGQLADFLLGWTGLDIAGDDHPPAREKPALPDPYWGQMPRSAEK